MACCKWWIFNEMPDKGRLFDVEAFSLRINTQFIQVELCKLAPADNLLWYNCSQLFLPFLTKFTHSQVSPIFAPLFFVSTLVSQLRAFFKDPSSSLCNLEVSLVYSSRIRPETWRNLEIWQESWTSRTGFANFWNIKTWLESIRIYKISRSGSIRAQFHEFLNKILNIF